MKYIALLLSFAIWLFANTPQNVKIYLKWTHQAQFAGYYAALENGYYKDEGLEVELIERTKIDNFIDSVTKESASYGISDSSLIINYTRGDQVVLVAPIFQYSPTVLLTLKSSNIKEPKDFAGKRITMPKDGFDALPNLMFLRLENLEKSLHFSPHSYDASDLITGKTDIYSSYSTNEPFVLNEMGVEYNTIDPKSYGINLYEDLLFTSKQEAKDHPDRVARIKRATIKGWEWALANPEKSVELIRSKYNKNKSYEALFFELKEIEKLIRPELFAIGDISSAKLNAIAENMAKTGLISHSYNLDGFVFQQISSALKLSNEEREFLQANPVLRMGNDTNWAPFEYLDQNGEYKGLAADYIDLISKKLGVRFEPTQKPWFKVIEDAKNGEIDIFSCAVATTQRQEYMNFTSSYLSFPMVIATNEKVAYLRGAEDLQNYTIGVAKDYAAHDFIKEHYPKLTKIVAFDNVESGLNALSQGKIFAFIDNIGTITHEAKQLGLTNLKITGEFPHRYEMSIGVRKDYPLLLSSIQKALDSITIEEKNEIYQRWISFTYETKTDFTMLWKILAFAGLALAILLLWSITLKIKLKKELEKRLDQERMMITQSKLVAVGEMVRMVAHQWKQPLTVLSLILQELDELSNSKESKQLASDGLAKVNYMSSTIDDFNKFLSPSKSKSIFSIKKEIEETVSFLSFLFKRTKITTTIRSDGTESIFGYPNEFKQAILNILSNAKDAIVENNIADGQIDITISQNRDAITIEIEDNGGGFKGIASDDVFKAYETTKGKKGTGIGLYITRMIIKNSMEGTITASSGEKGAKFTIVLPQNID